jgi:glycosyltransferase involved in cell wall biosynthesis
VLINASVLKELPASQSNVMPGKGGPLRILFVAARYLPHVGGVEIHTYEVGRRLVAAGHRVSVLTTDLTGRLPAYEESQGIHIKRVRAWPSYSDYYFAPGIYNIIGREADRWDLIHCQGYNTFVAPLAMAAAWRAGIPYLVTFHSGGHSSRFRNALRPLQYRVLRPLLARAEQLIGVSRWEVRFFQERLGLPAERFSLISNGAYLPQGGAVNGAANMRQEAAGTLIVSVGRLERYKGHHRVIAALPALIKEVPDIRLRIIGSGPYEGALRRLAEQIGVADRVDIRGIPGGDRQEMARVLLGAKLVILLSDYESQGISVLEAISLGRPVLVAETTALRDLAESGLARATPLGSTAEEVAQAVLGQLRQPLLPGSVNLPTWDACAAELLNLYRHVTRKLQCAS